MSHDTCGFNDNKFPEKLIDGQYEEGAPVCIESGTCITPTSPEHSEKKSSLLLEHFKMKNGDLSHFWISKQENFANKNLFSEAKSTDDGLLVVRTLWFKSDAKARAMCS